MVTAYHVGCNKAHKTAMNVGMGGKSKQRPLNTSIYHLETTQIV